MSYENKREDIHIEDDIHEQNVTNTLKRQRHNILMSTKLVKTARGIVMTHEETRWTESKIVT